MVRYPPCPNLPPGIARHHWVFARFYPPKSAQVYQPLGRKEALTMPTSPRAKQLVLSTTARGWERLLNMVRWNGKEPKYHLRDWSPDGSKMGKGISMTQEELATLKGILEEMDL